MNVIFGHQIEEHRKVCRNIVIEAEKLLTNELISKRLKAAC
uniref:Uncharacterized protein n=1 Tax=uncultured Desulfobacterium sp. TaxID=201089 RepID=E1YC87_9BACT|nr:unknown protein [uncultured Desulfobacterium sp.]